MIDVQDLFERGLKCDFRVGVGLPEEAASELRKQLVKRRSKLQIVALDDPNELVARLKDEGVDCAVRGTLSSAEVIESIKGVFSVDQVMRAAILEEASGRPFILTPVGIDEGMDRTSRLGLVNATLSYFSELGWRMSVGVLSKGRLEDSRRSSEIEASLKDGEWLVDRLLRDGVEAEHYSILIEDAVAGSDLVLAPDGVSGNLIFRSMHFLGGGKAFGAPVLNIRPVFVDTSRAKCDFVDSVLLAAGIVHARAGMVH